MSSKAFPHRDGAALLADLAQWAPEAIELRHAIHANPETAYEEHRTAALVADMLTSYGLEVHRGIGKTGVVGVLRQGGGAGAIGLRADMDALAIREQSDLPYRSTVPGTMHACGHDGHTTMLQLAACHLSATRAFDGTVVFIFQPAEEGGAGARKMLRDGLFTRFPVDAVYAMRGGISHPTGWRRRWSTGSAIRRRSTAPAKRPSPTMCSPRCSGRGRCVAICAR